MGGRTLAHQLKAVYPNLSVLFMSGYTENTIIHQGLLEPDTAFLQKPFIPEVLARQVRELLDQGENA